MRRREPKSLHMKLRSGGQKQYVEKKKKYIATKPQRSKMPTTPEAKKGVEGSVSGTSGDLTPQVATSTPRHEMTSERVEGVVPGWELSHVDGGNRFLAHDVPTYGPKA